MRTATVEILEEDDAVRFLVLAASSGDQPGPLVSLLAGQKSGKLPVPIVIVPQDLSIRRQEAQVDRR
jgi:hypothetical protein